MNNNLIIFNLRRMRKKSCFFNKILGFHSPRLRSTYIFWQNLYYIDYNLFFGAPKIEVCWRKRVSPKVSNNYMTLNRISVAPSY